eukprot:CAMPEP_0183831702 /NCGR_PEP_ID=MMETSP0807_2-20130328/4925_1 /TAXON_ID=88271 /ORGANISM="Picocystis salinarum, Strain CCMP1897" /LENGTH=36 /DNA_ID= /DNA_START= /DNA_END= /DNA_ORIENTATION=
MPTWCTSSSSGWTLKWNAKERWEGKKKGEESRRTSR